MFPPCEHSVAPKQHLGRTVSVVLSGARGQYYANWLLDALKDAGIDFRLMSLRGAVDHPYVIAGPAQVIAHLLKPQSAEKTGDGDIANYSGCVSGAVIIDFPRRPAPKIDIEVAQMLTVDPRGPLRRRHPISQWSTLLRLRTLPFNPAPKSLGFHFVGRVPYDYCNGLFPLDLVRFLAGFRYRRQNARNPTFVIVRISQGIGYKHPSRCRRWSTCKIDNFGKNAELGYGKTGRVASQMR